MPPQGRSFFFEALFVRASWWKIRGNQRAESLRKLLDWKVHISTTVFSPWSNLSMWGRLACLYCTMMIGVSHHLTSAWAMFACTVRPLFLRKSTTRLKSLLLCVIRTTPKALARGPSRRAKPFISITLVFTPGRPKEWTRKHRKPRGVEHFYCCALAIPQARFRSTTLRLNEFDTSARDILSWYRNNTYASRLGRDNITSMM